MRRIEWTALLMTGLLRDEVLAALDELKGELEADPPAEQQRQLRNRRRYIVNRALAYGAIARRDAEQYGYYW